LSLSLYRRLSAEGRLAAVIGSRAVDSRFEAFSEPFVSENAGRQQPERCG
jgi:hypothetical protein